MHGKGVDEVVKEAFSISLSCMLLLALCYEGLDSYWHKMPVLMSITPVWVAGTVYIFLPPVLIGLTLLAFHRVSKEQS